MLPSNVGGVPAADARVYKLICAELENIIPYNKAFGVIIVRACRLCVALYCGAHVLIGSLKSAEAVARKTQHIAFIKHAFDNRALCVPILNSAHAAEFYKIVFCREVFNNAVVALIGYPAVVYLIDPVFSSSVFLLLLISSIPFP